MAALTADKVVVELEAKLDRYNANIANASRTFDRSMDGMERSAKRAEGAIGLSFGRLASTLAAGFSLDYARKLVDDSQKIQNQLKATGLAGKELGTVYDSLFASAQKNSAPLESLVQLYSRVSLSQKELKVSSKDMLSFTDNIALALRVAGSSAQESSGALLQLSQALGGGVVRAEEFNSMLEGTLPIVQAAAAGIQQAGGSVAKLRALVNDGKVSSEAFFKGFQAGASTLQSRVANSVTTVNQAFTQLNNSLIDAAGKLDKTTGASDIAVKSLTRLSEILKQAVAPDGGLTKAIKQNQDQVKELDNSIKDFVNSPSFATFYAALFGTKTATLPGGVGGGTDPLYALLGGKSQETLKGLRDQNAEIKRQEEGVDALKDAYKKLAEAKAAAGVAGEGGTAGTAGQQSRLEDAFKQVTPAAAAPIDLNKFKPTGTKEKLDEFQRATRSYQERVALMDVELKTLQLSNFEQDKQKAIIELQNAAKRAGLALTDETNKKIEQTANAYAMATERLRQAQEQQQRVNELASQFGNLAISSVEGLVDGTKSLNDVLADSLKLLARMALQAAFLGQGPLAGLFGTAPTQAGGVGGLFGGLASAFGGARAGGGPVQQGSAYLVGEKGPEMFLPGSNGSIVKNADLQRQGSGQGQPVIMNNDFRDSSADAIAVIMARIDRLERNLPRIAVNANQQALNLDPYALG